jgi:hypothetical protein
MSSFNHLLRLADRLAQVTAGSLEADRTLHVAIEARGTVPPYTSQDAAACLLLPDGFEWRQATYSGGLVYASCQHMRLDSGFGDPHIGQRGKTAALAMCGAAMRGRAGLVKGAGA